MLTNLVKTLFVVVILIFSTTDLKSQQSYISRNVNHISEYLASNHFIKLKNELGDLQSIDSIYIAAVVLTKNDYMEAFLAVTFATVPYKEIPIQIPLLKIKLYYPLISASDTIFKIKNENLPKYFFFDSPADNYGDKDKLAHFFGSAFISYASNIFDLGNPIGYFVEVFEETFKVQSSVDYRDLETNILGNLFGKLLKKNKNVLPSEILILNTLSKFSYNI